MEHIGQLLKERNIELDTLDPVTRGGFTQVPNFILKDSRLAIGPKLTCAMFLSYAWHNDFCFPGQQRLADDLGMGVASINRFVKELEQSALIEIERRGQGKTNIYKIAFVVQKKNGKVRKS